MVFCFGASACYTQRNGAYSVECTKGSDAAAKPYVHCLLHSILRKSPAHVHTKVTPGRVQTLLRTP